MKSELSEPQSPAPGSIPVVHDGEKGYGSMDTFILQPERSDSPKTPRASPPHTQTHTQTHRHSVSAAEAKKKKRRSKSRTLALRSTLTTPSKKEIAHQRGEPSYAHNEDVLFAPPRSGESRRSHGSLSTNGTGFRSPTLHTETEETLWERVLRWIYHTDTHSHNTQTQQSQPRSSSEHTTSAHSNDSEAPLYPRIIERGSEGRPGRVFVRKRIKKKDWYARYGFDWFHSLLNISTLRLIPLLLALYLSIVLFYTTIYYQIHLFYYCDLDFTSFVAAFDFTLETMATIGYSTKNIYFDDCVCVSVTLAAQMCTRLVIDALIIGVIYSKLARPHARASTVIFSDHAVIRRVRGKLFFMFQLCELRKHQLAEAHVRLYVIKREVDPSLSVSSESARETRIDIDGDETEPLLRTRSQSQKHSHTQPHPQGLHTRRHSLQFGDLPTTQSSHTTAQSKAQRHRSFAAFPSAHTQAHPQHTSHMHTFLQTSAMRLTHPNDELGAPLLLMLPQLVVHELDAVSPLMPPPRWRSARTAEVVRWHPPVYRPFERREEAHCGSHTHTEQHTPRAHNASISPHVHSPHAQTQPHTLAAEPLIADTQPLPQRVFRAFSVGEPPLPSSSMLYGNDVRDTRTYDVNMLSAISFPNVIRRAQDYTQQSASVGLNSAETAERAAFHGDRPRMECNVDIAQVITAREGELSTLREGGEASAPNISLSLPLREQEGDIQTEKERRRSQEAAVSELLSPGMLQFAQDMGTHTFTQMDRERLDSGVEEMNMNMNARVQRTRTTSQDGGISRERTSEKTLPLPFPRRDSMYESMVDDMDAEQQPAWQREEREMVQRYLLDRQVEIVAVVEGIDTVTGGIVQARHSFVFNEIEWDKRFQHCVYQDPDDFYATVDFDLFHELVDAPKDAAYAGPIHSCI